ncbi:hypothetical protein ACH5RR_009449 [Cinchona calisaya]|uniref:Uncharacterized protein n=1 Tax=Cinchona calisaya TaxID=153742 RepID=A0ABD3AEH3_9GENT
MEGKVLCSFSVEVIRGWGVEERKECLCDVPLWDPLLKVLLYQNHGCPAPTAVDGIRTWVLGLLSSQGLCPQMSSSIVKLDQDITPAQESLENHPANLIMHPRCLAFTCNPMMMR